EVAGAVDHVAFEPLAVPHANFPAEHMERRLVRLVLMRFGAGAGRYRKHLHMDSPRPDRFGGDRGSVGKALLADERFARAQAAARSLIVDDHVHASPPSRPVAYRG